MDFDGVMARWSRFHFEVDGARKGGGAASINPRGHGDGGYSNQDKTLKRRSSEQCTRLLEALERNHNCILHHALPS